MGGVPCPHSVAPDPMGPTLKAVGQRHQVSGKITGKPETGLRAQFCPCPAGDLEWAFMDPAFHPYREPTEVGPSSVILFPVKGLLS